MNYYVYNDELYHHGVLGMKWGVRRYQNPDGTLTPAGQRHYGTSRQVSRLEKRSDKLIEKYKKAYHKQVKKELRKSDGSYSSDSRANMRAWKNPKVAKIREASDKMDNLLEEARKSVDPKKEKIKRIATLGGVAVGTILGAYAAVKIRNMRSNSAPIKYPSSSDIKRRVNQNLNEDYMNNLKRTLDNATRASRMRNSVNSARNQYVFTGNDKAWKNVMSDMANMSIDELKKLGLY